MTTRVLLVDDNGDFLASASRLLESQGLEVVGRASSGVDALEAVRRLEPDLVLVDIELGDEDGIALTHAIRAQSPELQMVLISAYERDDLDDLIVVSSAAGFVPKRALGADAIAAVLGA